MGRVFLHWQHHLQDKEKKEVKSISELKKEKELQKQKAEKYGGIKSSNGYWYYTKRKPIELSKLIPADKKIVMKMYDLLHKKACGQELTPEQEQELKDLKEHVEEWQHDGTL